MKKTKVSVEKAPQTTSSQGLPSRLRGKKNALDFQRFRVFAAAGATGNIAAVTLLEKAIPFWGLRQISRSQVAPTTVFLLPLAEKQFRVQFYGRQGKILRCGHGALAAAAWLRQHSGNDHFSAELIGDRRERFTIEAKRDQCSVDFAPCTVHRNEQTRLLEKLCNGIDAACTAKRSGYYICELSHRRDITGFSLSEAAVKLLANSSLIVTARDGAGKVFFRYFFPRHGHPNNPWGEDQATGSALPVICAYYGNNDRILRWAQQCSPGGGLLGYQKVGDKLRIFSSVMPLTAPRRTSDSAHIVHAE